MKFKIKFKEGEKSIQSSQWMKKSFDKIQDPFMTELSAQQK